MSEKQRDLIEQLSCSHLWEDSEIQWIEDYLGTDPTWKSAGNVISRMKNTLQERRQIEKGGPITGREYDAISLDGQRAARLIESECFSNPEKLEGREIIRKIGEADGDHSGLVSTFDQKICDRMPLEHARGIRERAKSVEDPLEAERMDAAADAIEMDELQRQCGEFERDFPDIYRAAVTDLQSAFNLSEKSTPGTIEHYRHLLTHRDPGALEFSADMRSG